MQTDGLHVAVRPRGILECLDLSVMFCGRRPLAVAVATVIGSAPFILLNRLLVADATDSSLLLGMVPLLGVETAWAAVPLTLYLGQSVFADRFSWRHATRAWLGGLPALVLFQTLLRGICLVLWVLAPVVFVGMYYLDQIILLERPGVTRIWQRRVAMARGHSMHQLRLACLDGLILAAGTVIGIRLLAAVAAIWQGRGLSVEAIWLDDEAGLLPALLSWHGQIAFWATCGFLTVFRFFTYLDSRIRREGWDVELRLRADDTYRGLSRLGDQRRRAASTLLVAAVVAAGSAGTALPADGRGAGGTGTQARAALDRQAFPWYDSATDRYRSVIRADRDASSRPPGSPRPDPVSRELIEALGNGLMIALLVAAAGGLVIAIIRFAPQRSPPEADDGRIEPAPSSEDPEPLPAGIDADEGDLLTRVSVLAEQGDFTAAMLHLHAWMLVTLDRRGGLTLARGKTQRQYAGELAASMPGLASLFRASGRLFEDAFFGRITVSRDDFLAIWSRRELVLSSSAPTPTTP